MKRFIEGEDRSQSTLFPERLDDYISEDNAARVVDAFVDRLELAELGFARAEPSVTGRPAYHPAMLLKMYIYGYLNRIQSSRRLERSESKARGRYSKADFRYDAERNEYVCPANERLTYRFDSVERGKKLWVYTRYGCSSCPLHDRCTSGNARRLKRWEKEAVLDKAALELKRHPDAMRRRKALVEHPFSTIKQGKQTLGYNDLIGLLVTHSSH